MASSSAIQRTARTRRSIRRRVSPTTRRRCTSPCSRSILSRRRLVGIRTRRDEYSPSDWIRVMVDSFHDKRSAFEFAVNPAGVKQDAYWFNDGNQDQGWDAVWDVAVSRDARGWRAEFRIPFSQLRFHPAQRRDVRLRRRPPDRPVERDDDLAAAVEERERLRVVVRRADQPAAESIARSGSRWCRIWSAT